MKTNLSLNSLKSGIGHFFGRYHTLLFVVIALGGLALAIYFLNQSLTLSAANNGYQANTTNIVFDKSTMEDLSKLKKNSEQTELEFPAGRVNPFSE